VVIATARVTAADAPAARVELLHRVATTVAVSSTVANPRILPHHLVDGDPATAWNSRTGDLVGAWIAIRLPPEAHVDVIRLSAGFTQVDNKADLFTMNPRIRKLRVSRNGKRLFEKQLNIESRALQDLPVDAPGGDFRIEVAEIVPGSKPSWREICVSELEVWGTPPPGTPVGQTTPAVRVGSLDASAVLGLRRGANGAAVLPLAVAAGGWVYLGHEDRDPGSGEPRIERTFREHAGPEVGYDLRRTIGPNGLPPRYRGAQGMKVTVYDDTFTPKCDGVLGAAEVAVEGLLELIPADDRSDAAVAAARRRIWAAPFAIAARLTAPCLDHAAWVRGAELPALRGPASAEPPAWLTAAARRAFRELAAVTMSDEEAALARSPYVTYVPAGSGHPAYVSAWFHIDVCHPGEFGAWGLWRVDGKRLTLVSEAHDVLAGALDIDGDGKDEVITGRGEIDGGVYQSWWEDLTPFMPAGLGCDGRN